MPGGYSWEFLVLVNRPVLQILTLVQTEKDVIFHAGTGALGLLFTLVFRRMAFKKLSHYYLQKDANKKIS